MSLEGTFHDTSLVDLFEIFRMGNKTGILRLFGPSQHSTIHVTIGRLIDAAVYDTSTQRLLVTGDDAILHMLKWESAEFCFTHDPSTVRHPVTIFHEIEQLVRLSAECPTSSLHTLQLPHMEMPILANLAFMHDLDSDVYATDRKISRHSCRLSSYSLTYDANPSAPPSPTQLLVLEARTAGQASTPAQVPQTVQPPRAVVLSAGRKVLAAVLRRVRAL